MSECKPSEAAAGEDDASAEDRSGAQEQPWVVAWTGRWPSLPEGRWHIANESAEPTEATPVFRNGVGPEPDRLPEPPEEI